MSFEFFLENVSDPTGHMSAVDFYELSDRSPEEMELFASAWYPLPLTRQRESAPTRAALPEASPGLSSPRISQL